MDLLRFRSLKGFWFPGVPVERHQPVKAVAEISIPERDYELLSFTRVALKFAFHSLAYMAKIGTIREKTISLPILIYRHVMMAGMVISAYENRIGDRRTASCPF
jgi:hypothetical protein